MSSQEVVDLIKNLLAPVDKTGRFHSEQIRAVCDLVYAQLMSSMTDVLFDSIDLYTKEYTSQTVSLDATRNLYYSTIPVDIVSIPGVCSGLLRVNSNQGQDIDYVPTTEMEWSYMAGTPVQTTDTTIGYWLQGSKIWFDESMTSDIASVGVRMVLLPKFKEFERTDKINIPGASDFQFIQQVIGVLAPTAVVDLKTNNQ